MLMSVVILFNHKAEIIILEILELSSTGQRGSKRLRLSEGGMGFLPTNYLKLLPTVLIYELLL